MSTDILGTGCGPGLSSPTAGESDHQRSVKEDHTGHTFVTAGNSGQARQGASPTAASPGASLVSLCLRLGVGIPELVSSFEKFQHVPEFMALWHTIHLPAADILAPAYATAELFGALMLLVGWQTRIFAVLFVAELLAEIVLTKAPLMRFAGWMLEWQSLWVVLVLARIGAGSWSLDGLLARRAGHAKHVQTPGPDRGR